VRLLRIVVTCLLVAAIATVLLIFDLWPWHPSSPLGWNLFAVSALPILIAGEWVGEKIVDNPVSKGVDRSNDAQSHSHTRRPSVSMRRTGCPSISNVRTFAGSGLLIGHPFVHDEVAWPTPLTPSLRVCGEFEEKLGQRPGNPAAWDLRAFGRY
jgi:hypothetical protein